MLKDLFDPNLTAEEAGKKAYSLHQLQAAGFRVPPGFVIGPLHEPNASELEPAMARIGGFPVAVRSSANLEDLGGASFAGQYQTFLDVQSTAELLEKIALCRSSATSEQVQAYLRSKGMGHIRPRMTVLVQKMVPAKWAGVAFTIHPLTGKEETALVEYCAGLAEKLVSGHVIPTQYVIDLQSARVLEAQNETEHPKLPDNLVAEMTEGLLKVQARFQRPQDVEWAIDDQHTLYFLQARPVTCVRYRDDIDEFTNADFKDGGVSARICTPLMYSLYREVMQHSMPEYFRAIKLMPKSPKSEDTWIDMFYGRPYWNASAVKRVLLKVPGYDERAFDQDLGIQKEYGSKGPVRVPFSAKTLIPAIPVAIALEKEFTKSLKQVPEFLKDFEIQEREWLERIRSFKTTENDRFFTEFREVLFKFYLRSENAYFLTIYNNSNAQTELKSFLRRLDESIGTTTEIVKLMGGLNEIVHMELQKDLIGLQKTAHEKGIESRAYSDELKKFVERHYFHGEAELELMTPRWGEAPERVTAMIASILKSGTTPIDPVVSAERQRADFDAEVAKLRGRINASWIHRLKFRAGFEKQLRRARAFLVEREKMREASAKSYAIVRLYILEACRRWRAMEPYSRLLRKERDIFMLHLNELGILLDRPDEAKLTELQRTIRYRELMFEGYTRFVPPNELGRGISGTAEAPATTAPGASVLQGLGCSPGVHEGLVRRIDSADEMDQIRPGEILVTRFTDPGWTPILGMVQGVVTEVGGMLSHAAVIGREYGIPAVLNLKSATQVLSTGQRIRIDGTRGTVEILGSD